MSQLFKTYSIQTPQDLNRHWCQPMCFFYRNPRGLFMLISGTQCLTLNPALPSLKCKDRILPSCTLFKCAHLDFQQCETSNIPWACDRRMDEHVLKLTTLSIFKNLDLRMSTKCAPCNWPNIYESGVLARQSTVWARHKGIQNGKVQVAPNTPRSPGRSKPSKLWAHDLPRASRKWFPIPTWHFGPRNSWVHHRHRPHGNAAAILPEFGT